MMSANVRLNFGFGTLYENQIEEFVSVILISLKACTFQMTIGILEVYLLVTLQAQLLTNNKKGFVLKILKMIVSHETYRRV